jgi:hypothetical protein
MIDYGGLENEDVFAGKQWMVETYPEVDSERWASGLEPRWNDHLMNIFSHTNDFKVAYAGNAVSDLVARMGYKSQSYRDLFSAPHHIGKTAEDNVAEYRRRSPAWHAEKLRLRCSFIRRRTMKMSTSWRSST